MSIAQELATYAAAFLISVILGHIGTSAVVDSMWASLGSEAHRPTAWMPRGVGFVERTLYTAAPILGRPEFVAVWLAMKVAGQWKVWEEEGVQGKVSGRAVYNTFLVGNAVSIAYGVTGGLLVAWVRKGDLTAVLGVPLALMLSNLLLLWLVRRYQVAKADGRSAKESAS